MAATSSCEDFLAQALLSLKENPTSFNINSSSNTSGSDHRQSSLKGCYSSENNTTSFVYIPPLLMEPSLQDSYSDLNQYEKLQLKSLTDGSSGSSSSLLLRKKPSMMMNTSALFHTTTTTSSAAATTPQQRHDLIQRSDMDRKQNWDLISSPVGISKPRKMISRWYAESGSSLVAHPSILNTTTTTTSVTSNSQLNNTKMYHTRSVTESSQVYQHPHPTGSDRSESSNGEEDDMEDASNDYNNADEDFIVSSEEDGNKSTPQKKRKQTIRKKKKHTTKGQFNTGWWSDDEHLRFLKGLKECGHNWSLISTKYVKTRGRRQCASHAQKWYQSERYAEEREKMDSL
ncbi:hypothetical protein C9374_006847 [Naegleria lovaniensis]|uniref:Myb domain-containing protein n=1 Tax=Naegleria lovaniensis TaxID=51637 RepID=A0AA88H3S5_NAELO|nr:uncharacterized protein C9374_006847 [Naegleria lovaniensis]KAG2393316.1 hypothetical protein C9374_006847 [Naegleria lovaniensis]